jgi:hypothetical protein
MPNIPSIPTPIPSKQLRQDMQRRTGSTISIDVPSRPSSRFRPQPQSQYGRMSSILSMASLKEEI